MVLFKPCNISSITKRQHITSPVPFSGITSFISDKWYCVSKEWYGCLCACQMLYRHLEDGITAQHMKVKVLAVLCQ